jgi:hypothetical protein
VKTRIPLGCQENSPACARSITLACWPDWAL